MKKLKLIVEGHWDDGNFYLQGDVFETDDATADTLIKAGIAEETADGETIIVTGATQAPKPKGR